MVKIITYIDSKSKGGFSRSNKEKGDDRIYAEVELEQMLNTGWTLLSASTSDFVTGAFTATTSFTKLTVILQKGD